MIIFAAKMMGNVYRNTVAALLLAILLPVLTVLPFHHHDIHEHSEISCEQCTNHQPHRGHLTTSWNIDNCLICQFLGVTYVPSQRIEAPDAPQHGTTLVNEQSAIWQSATIQLLSTRAPPTMF